MTTTQALLTEIEEFSRKAGISPSTLSRKAINDGKLPGRLRRGGSVTLETAEKLREWMRENSAHSVVPHSESPEDPQHDQGRLG